MPFTSILPRWRLRAMTSLPLPSHTLALQAGGRLSKERRCRDFRWRTAFFSRGLEAANLVVCPSLAFARVLNAIYGRTAVAVHNGRSSEGAGAGLAAPAPFAFTAGRLWDEGKDVATLDAAAGLTNVPLYAAGAEEGPNGARIELRHAQALG